MKNPKDMSSGPKKKSEKNKDKEADSRRFSSIGALFFLASAALAAHYLALPAYEKIKKYFLENEEVEQVTRSLSESSSSSSPEDGSQEQKFEREENENAFSSDKSLERSDILKIAELHLTVPNFVINPFLDQLSFKYEKEKKAFDEVSFAGSDKRSIDDVLSSILFVNGFYSPDQLHWYKYVKPALWDMNYGKGILLTKEGHVLLPAHVLNPDLDQFSDFSTYEVRLDENHFGRVTNILTISKKYDLALVKTDYKPKQFVAPVFRTSELLQAGFLVTRLTKEEDEKTKKITIVSTDGIRDKISSEYKNNALIYSDGLLTFDVSVYDVFSKPGYSGSPIIDSGGSIVGILVGSTGSGASYAVNSEHVQELITGYLSELQKIDLEKEKVRSAQKEKAKKAYALAIKNHARGRKEKGIQEKIAKTEKYEGRNDYSSDFILGDTLRYYENHLTPADPYTKKGTFDPYSSKKKDYKDFYNSSFTKEQKKAEEDRIRRLKMLIKGYH